MATFPSITPTYGMRKQSKPKVRVTSLGDGYEFRALYGLPLSQDPKVYDLTFNVSETNADVIEAFLRSRVADQASFTFTPPAEGFSAKTGTFVQSDGSGAEGTIITITFANHGVAIGDVLTVDFSSGPTDGSYVVASSADANTFTLTSTTADSALVTVATNVDFTLSGAGQYVCDSWTKTIPYNNRAIINCSFREVFEP
jgi:phage-related protein